MPYTGPVYQRKRMCLKYRYHLVLLLLIHILTCLPYTPIPIQKLPKPSLFFAEMAFVPDPLEGYREAICLRWTMPGTENENIRSFTLIRKFSSDSLFEVFGGSRLIPGDTCRFCDILDGHTFPFVGFDSVFYRIYAVDKSGLNGDTSDICKVILAPQPRLLGYDADRYCFKWESWIRGGVFSWCAVRHENKLLEWTSEPAVLFPQTDEPALFSSCFPDSMKPPAAGRWYYGLFVKANDSYSLKIGYVDVK